MGGLIESIQKLGEVVTFYASNPLPSVEEDLVRKSDLIDQLSHGTGRQIKHCFECEITRGCVLGGFGAYVMAKNSKQQFWYNKRPWRQAIPAALVGLSGLSFYRAFNDDEQN